MITTKSSSKKQSHSHFGILSIFLTSKILIAFDLCLKQFHLIVIKQFKHINVSIYRDRTFKYHQVYQFIIKI